MKKIFRYAVYGIISAITFGVVSIVWQSGFDMYHSLQTLMESPPVSGSLFFGIFMFIYYLVQDFRKSKAA